MKSIRKMVGNLNIKLGILLIAISLVSCSRETKEAFIEHNFLNIVDTNAYFTGNFRPLPPLMTGSPKDLVVYQELSICLNTNIKVSAKNSEEIEEYLKYNKQIKDIYDDLEGVKYSEFNLSSNFPNKIGKYSINTHNPEAHYAGNISITNFKTNGSKCFLIVEKSYEKSLISILILFKKIKGEWKITGRETLYQT